MKHLLTLLLIGIVSVGVSQKKQVNPTKFSYADTVTVSGNKCTVVVKLKNGKFKRYIYSTSNMPKLKNVGTYNIN